MGPGIPENDKHPLISGMKSYNGVLNTECVFFGLNSLPFERYRNDVTSKLKE